MKKLRTGIMAVVVVVLTATSNLPASAAELTNYGSFDCGKWFTSEPAKFWLLGFLSGANFGRSAGRKNYDPLAKVKSTEKIYLWMDNYCKENPLETVNNGASALFIEIEYK